MNRRLIRWNARTDYRHLRWYFGGSWLLIWFLIWRNGGCRGFARRWIVSKRLGKDGVSRRRPRKNVALRVRWGRSPRKCRALRRRALTTRWTRGNVARVIGHNTWRRISYNAACGWVPRSMASVATRQRSRSGWRAIFICPERDAALWGYQTAINLETIQKYL